MWTSITLATCKWCLAYPFVSFVLRLRCCDGVHARLYCINCALCSVNKLVITALCPGSDPFKILLRYYWATLHATCMSCLWMSFMPSIPGWIWMNRIEAGSICKLMALLLMRSVSDFKPDNSHLTALRSCDKGHVGQEAQYDPIR